MRNGCLQITFVKKRLFTLTTWGTNVNIIRWLRCTPCKSRWMCSWWKHQVGPKKPTWTSHLHHWLRGEVISTPIFLGPKKNRRIFQGHQRWFVESCESLHPERRGPWFTGVMKFTDLFGADQTMQIVWWFWRISLVIMQCLGLVI